MTSTCLSDDAAPCSSACPSGDCAGCAFPAAVRRVTPIAAPDAPAPCSPSRPCPNTARCVRFAAGIAGSLAPVIDGTVAWPADEGRCPLFRDVRAETLRQALAPAFPSPTPSGHSGA